MEQLFQKLDWLASMHPGYAFAKTIAARLRSALAAGDGRAFADLQGVKELLLANHILNLPNGYRIGLSLYYSGGVSRGVVIKMLLLSRAKTNMIPPCTLR